MSQKSNNIPSLDTLRALAMLGVIVIHVSTPLVNMTFGDNMAYWWVGNIVDSSVRFAVPLFLMLSGATMLGKEYKLSSFYHRRFMRVLLPFLFWLIAYWVYRWVMLRPVQQPHDFDSIIRWATNLFLNEGVSKHFWYVYMILFIYLILPFLSRVVVKLPLAILSNIVLVWVIFAFVCRSVPQNMYSWAGDYGSKLMGYALHTGYLLLGYYLMRLNTSAPKIRLAAAVLFLATVALAAGFTFIFSQTAGENDLSLYSYLSINSILQSIALFVWVKNSSVSWKPAMKIQNLLSDYSYGIYLVHIMVIGVLFRNGIYWKIAHPLLSLPLLTLMVTATSFVLIFVLRRLPFGKYFAG